jgi:hypothetical protein
MAKVRNWLDESSKPSKMGLEDREIPSTDKNHWFTWEISVKIIGQIMKGGSE